MQGRIAAAACADCRLHSAQGTGAVAREMRVRVSNGAKAAARNAVMSVGEERGAGNGGASHFA